MNTKKLLPIFVLLLFASFASGVQTSNLNLYEGIYTNTTFSGEITQQSNYNLSLNFQNNFNDTGKLGLNVTFVKDTNDGSFGTYFNRTGYYFNQENVLSDGQYLIIENRSALNQEHEAMTVLFYGNISGSVDYLAMKADIENSPTTGFVLTVTSTAGGGLSLKTGNTTNSFEEFSFGFNYGDIGCFGFTMNTSSDELRWFNGGQTASEVDVLTVDQVLGNEEELVLFRRAFTSNSYYSGVITNAMYTQGWLTDLEAYEWCQNARGNNYIQSGTYYSLNTTSDSGLYDSAYVNATINLTTNTEINVTIYNSNTDTESSPQTLSDGDSSLTFSSLSISLGDNISARYYYNSDNLTSALIYTNITLFTASAPASVGDTLQTNLTFDVESTALNDTSQNNYNYTTNGQVNWVNSTFGKYYGAYNFTDGSSNYINATPTFGYQKSFSTSMWVWYEDAPGGSGEEKGLFEIRNSTNWAFSCAEDNFGFRCKAYNTSNQETDRASGVGTGIRAEQWTHYFIQRGEVGGLQVWRNGEILINKTQDAFELLTVSDVQLNFGKSGFGTDLGGYLDEILVWNQSNFTTNDVLDVYNSRRLGTPPEIDIYTEAFMYELPYNYSHENNTLNFTGIMPINITLKNQGNTTSGVFNWSFEVEDVIVCSDTITLSAFTNVTYICNWTKVHGWNSGQIKINISDDVNQNNNLTVYIPFVNRPDFHFNTTEYYENKPFCENSSNSVAYASCNWISGFDAMGDFSASYDCGDVDSYGGNTRQAAMGCMHNGYDMTSLVCNKSMNHLRGWLNRTTSGCTNVQEVHSFLHVGIAFDIMFPKLSESDVKLFAQQANEKCQYITDLTGVKPYEDTPGTISGDNGKGFGSGIGGFCYSIAGLHNKNPSVLSEIDQLYWHYNYIDEWMDREDGFLYSYKNDTYASYEEAWAYFTYASPHLGDVMYFRNRTSIRDNSPFENAICAMGRQYMYSYLDDTYDGNTLRNDESYNFRAISQGDTNSYQKIDDSLFTAWGTPLLFAYACKEIETKKSLLYLRDRSAWNNDGGIDYISPYLYKLIVDQLDIYEIKSPSLTQPWSKFDNANDIFYMRMGGNTSNPFTYRNDTVFQVDGGEERGNGHSQAQGYMLYAMGEPFIDYPQVPYNDDVRMDVWQNGISFQNITQTVEGTGGIFNTILGQYGYNQYYGMSSATKANSQTDYPSYRIFSKTYGGDLEDYVMTNNSKFGAVYDWKPHFNVTYNTNEYYIKYGDLLLKRIVVSGNEGIYHRFLNLNNEFNASSTTTSLRFTRSNKNVDINVTYSNESYNTNIDETGISSCYQKTSCSGGSKGTNNYRSSYFYTPSSNWDMIFYHHWYQDGYSENIVSVGGNDKGVFQGSNVLLFDNDGDNNIESGVFNATGWGLVYNNNLNETGALNTTLIKIDGWNLYSSNDTMSVFIHRDKQNDKIVLTANSYDDIDNDGYDTSKDVNVTINCSELINDTAPFNVTKNGVLLDIGSQSGDSVSFIVNTDQNSDIYEIVAFSESGSSPTTTSTSTSSTSTSSTTTTTTTTTTLLTSCENAYDDTITAVGTIATFMVIIVVAFFAALIFLYLQYNGADMSNVSVYGFTIVLIIIGLVVGIGIFILSQIKTAAC